MAAIGLAQIDRLEEFRSSRQRIVYGYLKAFSKIEFVRVLNLDFAELISHIFVVRVQRRDELREYLLSCGIECGLHYKPNHLLTKYKKTVSLPVTEELYKELLTLPCHNDLTESEQLFVVDKIKCFYNC